jgi:4a-hydroxytetrahydrobiopterin dehydratase
VNHPLTPEERSSLATALPLWRLNVDGDPGDDLARSSLIRDVEAASFVTAIEWVVRVAEAAERLDHHPDIDIRWRRLHLVLSTHSVGSRVTELDVRLAREIDAIVQ